MSLVPIMVGETSAQQEQEYGRILAPYFNDPETTFIISTDFCLWGVHYGYMPIKSEPGSGEIW